MNKTKIACFGLQGFGNDALLSLHNLKYIEITGVYTRKESHSFTYYACDTIESVAERMGMSVHFVPLKGDWDCGPADLAIVASFHRIFKKQHLTQFRHVINIHTSLLPKYKGATATNWMIKNGERIVGLTAHLIIDEGIDSGPILFQRRVLNPYLNDNQLRKALSFLIRGLVSDIVDQYPNYKEISGCEGGSYFPARTEADALAKLSDFSTIDELIFHIKAFTNFPMPKIEIDGRIFVIDYENPGEGIQIKLGKDSFYLLGYWLANS